MKKLLFVVFMLGLLLFLAREKPAEEPTNRTTPPTVYVTVGERLVKEGGASEWRQGGVGFTAAYPSLESLAERMEYVTVSETQAKCSFTLPPTSVTVSCYQYVDGKLIPGEAISLKDDGTLELLPGKWIYRIYPFWYSAGEDYVGKGILTFGIDRQ